MGCTESTASAKDYRRLVAKRDKAMSSSSRSSKPFEYSTEERLIDLSSQEKGLSNSANKPAVPGQMHDSFERSELLPELQSAQNPKDFLPNCEDDGVPPPGGLLNLVESEVPNLTSPTDSNAPVFSTNSLDRPPIPPRRANTGIYRSPRHREGKLRLPGSEAPAATQDNPLAVPSQSD